MTNYAWDLTDPAAGLEIANIPAEIRETKDMVGTNRDKEHVAYSGATLAGCGGEHKAGSARAYYQSAEPTNRPDGSTALNNGSIDDSGRLWVDKDNRILKVYDDADAFVNVTLAGLAVTDAEGDGSASLNNVALLAGRVGGQTLAGGTAAGDGLSLEATTGTPAGAAIIQVVAAKTDYVVLNDVPLYGSAADDGVLYLGGSTHANKGPIEVVAARTTLVDFKSTDGTDGVQLKGVKKASAAHDALTKGTETIVLGDCAATGGVPFCCEGTGTGAGANLTANVTFAPDLIFAWRTDASDKNWMWHSGDASAVIQLWNGNRSAADLPFTVATTTITFVDGKGLNEDENTFAYIAFKANLTVDAA